jgi:hypothetical protein
VAMDRMMNSRKNISKTNKLITGNWKNAFITIKIASISQKVLDGFGLVLDKYDLIRKYGFRDSNFKKYSYTESIASISAKSQRYYVD